MQRHSLIDAVCEAFGCLPRAAVAELESDPELLVVKILDMRHYAAAHRAFSQARQTKNPAEAIKPWADNPHMELVLTHAHELRREQRERDDG